MLKILATQLSGLFKKILTEEDYGLEDCSRLLAQAAIGDGTIYIHGFGEMKGIEAEAFEGVEPFSKGKPLVVDGTCVPLTNSDRVLIFTRSAHDEEANQLAMELEKQGIPFASVSSFATETSSPLLRLADVHIDYKLVKGLIPDDSGQRFGVPTLMAGLFVYYGIKFTLDEILNEVNE